MDEPTCPCFIIKDFGRFEADLSCTAAPLRCVLVFLRLRPIANGRKQILKLDQTMTSRLKSFHTPSSSPVQNRRSSQPPSTPPSRPTESTFHRKTRSLLQELCNVARTWDDLVLVDGLKAARELTDTRTDLEYVPQIRGVINQLTRCSNALKLIPDRRPRTHLVQPNLLIMDDCILKLDAVVLKLVSLSFWSFHSVLQAFYSKNNSRR